MRMHTHTRTHMHAHTRASLPPHTPASFLALCLQTAEAVARLNTIADQEFKLYSDLAGGWTMVGCSHSNF